jgi:hypothetical protein
MEEGSIRNPINESQHPELPVTRNDFETSQHKGKKRVKDYLLEGLMIFVAVVMGFLAENVREGIGNREKERQYMLSYLKNLEQDSIVLEHNIFDNNRKVIYLDSLISFSRKDISTVPNRTAFYYFCLHTIGYYSEFSNNDATFLQLTYSGGLRLIKKDHVADSIADYAARLKNIYGAEGLYGKATEAATMAAHEVLDFTVVYDSIYYKLDHPTGVFIPLISEDKQKLKLLYNKISFERAATQNYVRELNSLKPFLAGFIVYLREQYPNE